MAVPVRRLLLILLLITLTGDQWAVLQSAAWATMIVNYLRTDSLPQAVTYTFDGRHPCPFCNAITQNKKSENKSDYMPNLTRLEFLPVDQECALVAPDRFQLVLAESDEFAQILAKPPLTPPPRAIRA
jgi:hypothetical protein